MRALYTYAPLAGAPGFFAVLRDEIPYAIAYQDHSGAMRELHTAQLEDYVAAGRLLPHLPRLEGAVAAFRKLEATYQR
jgi:hypothetical protein